MRYAVALLYLVTLVWFAYHLDGAEDWVAVAVIFVLPFAAGLIAGVWAMPVPVLAFLLAVPAGYGSGEIPIWVVMMFAGLVALPEIVIGWGTRWVVTWYGTRRGTQ